MAVTRYQPSTDPLAPLFGDLLGTLNRGGRLHETLRAPEAEVVETENDIRVVVDAPGMTPEDIEISLEDNLLTLSGERRSPWTEEDESRRTWHLSERRYGRFSRSFVLPRDVEQDRIEARFENGVLLVTIPKSERARRRRIEIQSGDGARRVDSVRRGS